MNAKIWYATEAQCNWLAVARLLAAWNSGERPATLRGYACVSLRAAQSAWSRGRAGECAAQRSRNSR